MKALRRIAEGFQEIENLVEEGNDFCFQLRRAGPLDVAGRKDGHYELWIEDGAIAGSRVRLASFHYLGFGLKTVASVLTYAGEVWNVDTVGNLIYSPENWREIQRLDEIRCLQTEAERAAAKKAGESGDNDVNRNINKAIAALTDD